MLMNVEIITHFGNSAENPSNTLYKMTNAVYTHSIMNYIIFDLEWNQCPDGKEFEDPSLPFEILEIGAIKLDSNYHELGRFHEQICPAVYTSMHEYTQELLHMDMESLKMPVPFLKQQRISCPGAGNGFISAPGASRICTNSNGICAIME